MAASKELTVAVAQLCKTCRQLENFDKILDPQIGRLDGELWTLDDQWPDLPLLEASAKAGCDFCRLLRESLLSAPEDHSRRNATLARVHIRMLRVIELCKDNSLWTSALCGFQADLRFPRSSEPWVTVRRAAFVTWTDLNPQMFHPRLGVKLEYESSARLDVSSVLGSFKGFFLVANPGFASVRGADFSILLWEVTSGSFGAEHSIHERSYRSP